MQYVKRESVDRPAAQKCVGRGISLEIGTIPALLLPAMMGKGGSETAADNYPWDKKQERGNREKEKGKEKEERKRRKKRSLKTKIRVTSRNFS